MSSRSRGLPAASIAADSRRASPLPDCGGQQRISSTSYRANIGSDEMSAIFSICDCDTNKRSNGSRWIIGRRATRVACCNDTCKACMPSSSKRAYKVLGMLRQGQFAKLILDAISQQLAAERSRSFSASPKSPAAEGDNRSGDTKLHNQTCVSSSSLTAQTHFADPLARAR